MAIKFSNYASSLLTAAIAAGDTSASVVSTATFPALSAGDYFYATLTDANDAAHEIVKVTAVASSTFTITRAQDGTMAQAWPAGTKIEMRWNAASVADLDAACIHALGIETMKALKKINFNAADIAPIDSSVALQIVGADGAGVRQEFCASGIGATVLFRYMNGTLASPTAVASGDSLGAMG